MTAAGEAALLRRAAPAARPSVGDIVARAITPKVAEIDAGLYPEDALRDLGAAGAFAHHVAGGPGGLIAAVVDMAEVGETCLSTAFCMWCQNALAFYLDRSGNRALAKMRDAVATGARLGGTGLSNPMKAFSGIEPLALSGERAPGGYRVSGRLPWVSNLGPGHLFAAIFALADGRRVMALIDCADPGVKILRTARFVALEGTGTYTAGLRDVFVPEDRVIAEDAAAFVPGIRQGFVILQLGMALGLARGAARLMLADRSKGRGDAAFLPVQPGEILDRSDALLDRAARLAPASADPSRAAFLEVLRLRLDASWLALDAANAAALQYGARGYLAGAEVDRRLREARFVAIVTPSVKHITTELARGPAG